jgi:DNA-binding HxlR family transcriptional regulator
MIENGRYRFDERCGRVAEVLQRVGDKWSVLIIVLLEHGPRRFNDLKRAIPGISQRMLTLTLRGLERDGLVGRAVVPKIPPHVTYDLTELGRSLAGPVRVLSDWAHEHIEAIDEARARYAQQPSEDAAETR